MTSPGGLGSAFITVRANVSRFAADARRGIQNAIRTVASRLNWNAITRSAGNAGVRAGQYMGNGIYRGADGRLRDLRGRFVSEGALQGRLYSSAFNRTAKLDPRGLLAFSGLLPKILAGLVGIAKTLPTIIALLGELGQVGVAAAASLPFLITTALLVKSTFNNAFKGVGDAISAAFEKDPAKLQQALEDLTPAARAFVLEINAFVPAFEKAQKGAQEAFFQPLEGAFTELGKSGAIQTLGLAISRMAQDAGFAARDILEVITASQKSGQLNNIFTGSASAFAQLLAIAGPLTKVFLDLANAAAPFVNLLVGKFSVQAFKLFEAIEKGISSGSLATGFDNALVALSALGQLLGDIGSILSSVFGALSAGGESVLGTFAAVTTQLAEFLKSAEGTQALEAVATVLHLIAQTVTNLLAPLLPLVAQLLIALGPPLVRLLQTLGPPLTRLIDALVGILVPLIDALAPVLMEIIGILADGLASVLIQVADAVYELTPSLTELFKALGPAMITVVKGFADVLTSLLPILPDMIEAFLNIVPILIELSPLIVAGSQAFAGLALAVSFLLGWLAKLYGAALKYIAQGVAWILLRLIDVLQAIPGVVTKVFESVINFFTKTIPEFFGFAEKGFTDFGDTVAALPAMISNALLSLGAAITQPFTLGFGQAGDAVSTGINNLFSAIGKIPGRLVDWVGSIGSAAARIGRAIGEGIANIPGFAVDIAGKIVSRIKGFANNVIYSINQGIYQIARLLPFSLPYIPYLAQGAIIDRPTMAVIGEAGREVVLPLNNPTRARELAVESGLMDVLGPGFGSSQQAPVVHVYIGDEEIVDRVDVRVQYAMAGQARELAFGSRGI